MASLQGLIPTLNSAPAMLQDPDENFIEHSWVGPGWTIDFSLSGLGVSSKQANRNFGPVDVPNLSFHRRFWGLGRAELQNPAAPNGFRSPSCGEPINARSTGCCPTLLKFVRFGCGNSQ